MFGAKGGGDDEGNGIGGPPYDGKPEGGCPGTEYWGLKLAKLAAAAAAAKPGRLPALKPGGNWLIT